MIDIGKILKRSWAVLWSYRVLWIFGILLALTAGSSFNGGNSGYQFSRDERDWQNIPPNGQMQEFNRWMDQNVEPYFRNPEQHIQTFIWIGVGILFFILLVSILMAFVRYVSENAVLRMVNDHEETGTKVTFSQGWRMGWSRRAFRMWVIDLIIGLPVLVFILLLAAVGFAIYFSIDRGSQLTSVIGVITSVGFLFLFIFLFAIGMAFLGLLREFFVRKAALENTGIGESFRSGWKMFKKNWKSAGLMWLVIAGLGFGMTIFGVIAFFLLIPAYIVMLIPAVLAGAVPGLIGFGITSLFTSGPLTWIIGAIAAIPLFFLVLFLPLALIGGWYKIFTSSAWTLAFREMKAMEIVAPEAGMGKEPGIVNTDDLPGAE